MATNKFATMLHRNIHAIAVVLVYAFLEWVLIALLLLHALFSYLIAAFISYFGLNSHCLFCSRFDRFLPSRHPRVRDLVCDDHAREIARLAAGLNRETSSVREERKLAGGRGMCEDCSSSWPALALGEKRHGSGTISALLNMGEEVRCSSCCAVLESGVEEMGMVLGEGGWRGERPTLMELGNCGDCASETADLGEVQDFVDREDGVELEGIGVVRGEEEKCVGDDASALSCVSTSTHEIHVRVHGGNAAFHSISQSRGSATYLQVSHEHAVKHGGSKRKCQSRYSSCASPFNESSEDRHEYQIVTCALFQTNSGEGVKNEMFLKREGKIEESSMAPAKAHIQCENKSFLREESESIIQNGIADIEGVNMCPVLAPGIKDCPLRNLAYPLHKEQQNFPRRPIEVFSQDNAVQVEEVSVSLALAAMEKTVNGSFGASQEIGFEIADAVPRSCTVKSAPLMCLKPTETCNTIQDDGSYSTRPSEIGKSEETESSIFKQLICIA